MTFFKNRRLWLETGLFILMAALVYLPNVFRFTFHRDDWYYIYDGIVLGPRAFLEMFENLRPLRGPLFAGLFALFGAEPLPYHLLLFLWRVLGGFGMFWLLRLLWPHQRQGAYWAAVLFAIYPGFLWWVGGFEYQPMVLSLGFQVFSIAFMLQAILSEGRKPKILWTAASILASWVYLGLVEYSIGMEFFRVLCAYVVVARGASRVTWKGLWLSIRASLPALLGPLLFLIWRMFFFENIRKAADVSLQLGRVGEAPLTLFLWIVRLLQSAVQTLVMAWTVPLARYFDADSVRQIALGWLLAGILAALVLLADRFLFREPSTGEKGGRGDAVLIGLSGLLAGLVPIVMANRAVSFDRFSHYTLPASMAALVVLFGLWNFLPERALRTAMVAALAMSAGLTHFNLSVQVAAEAQTLSQFWHQVAWRAPHLRPGTTLVVGYPGVTYAESSDLVWGPANIIYYPQPQSEVPIRVPISAARKESGMRKDLLGGEITTQRYIIINVFRFDPTRLLVLSQPSEQSCVHVMDRRWPAFDAYEDPTLIAIAKKSKVENILPGDASPRLPENLFGPEPAHEWCYYYQRADLARQQENWEQVTRIGEEAARAGFAPADPLEWIPFLQAHLILGDEESMREVAAQLKQNERYRDSRSYYKLQICGGLSALQSQGYSLRPQALLLATTLFCDSSHEE